VDETPYEGLGTWNKESLLKLWKLNVIKMEVTNKAETCYDISPLEEETTETSTYATDRPTDSLEYPFFAQAYFQIKCTEIIIITTTTTTTTAAAAIPGKHSIHPLYKQLH
jgi:hypothetical protein